MTTEMDNVAAVAARTSRTLRKLAEKTASQETELVALRAKVASYERLDRCRALATQMEEQGMSPSKTFQEKVAFISSYPNLDVVEESIKLASGGRLDLADVADKNAPGTVSAEDALYTFCTNRAG